MSAFSSFFLHFIYLVVLHAGLFLAVAYELLVAACGI